jgi:hypothetical protein
LDKVGFLKNDPKDCCVSAGSDKRQGRYYVFKNPTEQKPAVTSRANILIKCGKGNLQISVNAGSELDMNPGVFPKAGVLPSFVPDWMKGLELFEDIAWSSSHNWDCCDPKHKVMTADLAITVPSGEQKADPVKEDCK